MGEGVGLLTIVNGRGWGGGKGKLGRWSTVVVVEIEITMVGKMRASAMWWFGWLDWIVVSNLSGELFVLIVNVDLI